MGKLVYGSARSINFDDRTLAHLQIVIGAKLRRGESFSFSWMDDASVGNGRSSIWLAPNVSLHFKYNSAKSARINIAWVTELARLSNSVTGLHLVSEPELPPEPGAGETA